MDTHISNKGNAMVIIIIIVSNTSLLFAPSVSPSDRQTPWCSPHVITFHHALACFTMYLAFCLPSHHFHLTARRGHEAICFPGWPDGYPRRTGSILFLLFSGSLHHNYQRWSTAQSEECRLGRAAAPVHDDEVDARRRYVMKCCFACASTLMPLSPPSTILQVETRRNQRGHCRWYCKNLKPPWMPMYVRQRVQWAFFLHFDSQFPSIYLRNFAH